MNDFDIDYTLSNPQFKIFLFSKRRFIEINDLEEYKLEAKIFNIIGGSIYLPFLHNFIYIYSNILELSYDKEILNKYLENFYFSENYFLFKPSLVSLSLLYLCGKNVSYEEEYFLKIFDQEYTEDEIKYCSYHITLNIENLYIENINYFDLIDPNKIFRNKNNIQKLKNIDNLIVSTKLLGTGCYSSVYEAEYNNNIVAIKKYSSEHYINFIDMREFSILKYISNPYIISLIDIFIDFKQDLNYSIVTEKMECDLDSLIILSKDNMFDLNLDLIKKFSFQLLHAVKYLNSIDILHGDIKTKNILIKENNIKLIDFGMSIPFFSRSRKKSVQLYTPYYRPLEIFLNDDFGFET